MHFLIMHSVPLNGGDEALLRAAMTGLSGRFPGARFTVLCNCRDEARRYLPDLDLEWDWEYTQESRFGPLGRLAGRILSRPRPGGRAALENLIRDASVVLSAPGGFLTDAYPIEGRLQGLEAALGMGRPVVILGQSIGPFWRPESIRRLGKVLNRVSRICVRDALSRRNLLACGIDDGRILETADLCFLWEAPPRPLEAGAAPPRRVGLCFRTWPHGDSGSLKAILEKGAHLCRELLLTPDRELVFLSTCQGIPEYVDDSAIAARIVSGLPGALQARCRVDRSRHDIPSLIKEMSRLDAFIGMRLHACLLAMISGIPSMGLGYEPKTEEIFGQLGLRRLQIPFTSDAEEWLRCARSLLQEAPRIRRELPPLMEAQRVRARAALDAVGEAISHA